MRYPWQDQFSAFCPLHSSAVSVKSTFKSLPAAMSLPSLALCGAQHVLGAELLSCSLTNDIASMWNKVLTTSGHCLILHLCLEMKGKVQHLAAVMTLNKIQVPWNTWTISLENWVRFCVTILIPLHWAQTGCGEKKIIKLHGLSVPAGSD